MRQDWWLKAQNLFPHQRDALGTIKRYLAAGVPGSALIRMPTGTGKTGVIAISSMCFPEVKNALVVTPWRSLRRQMVDDLRDRFWSVVSIKPELRDKSVAAFSPSTLEKQLGALKTPHVFVGTIQGLQQLQANNRKLYARLEKAIDLVLVDEGHREPAPRWAKAVRDLHKPTVLFTATPYRNDFKVFNVDDGFVSVLTHDAAIHERFIRKVRFVERSFGGETPSAARFVTELLTTYQRERRRLPTVGRHPRVIVRCETAAAVADITQRLLDAGEAAIGIHETFEHNGPDEFMDTVPDTRTSDRVFWVHQNKLMEGLDDPSFSMLAFFEPFSNGRSLVQQVGRIVRNPGRAPNQESVVLADPSARQKRIWNNYLGFEKAFDPDEAEHRAGFRTLLSTQSEIMYVDGDYRARFDLNVLDIKSDLRLPLAAHVYRVPQTISADALHARIRQDLTQDDLDVLSEKDDGDIHVFMHLDCQNSPVLSQSALFEYRLGFTAVRRVNDYVFYCDSRSSRSECLLSIGTSVEPGKLERLYRGPGARLTNITLRNSDLGRHTVRRKTIQAFSIEDTAPGLSDYSHFCSVAQGYVRDGARDGARRYVGFSNGRVSDPSPRIHSLVAWRDWTEALATALEGHHGAPRVFKRFAERVSAPAPALCEPLNILVDAEDVLERYEDVNARRAQIKIDELCLDVVANHFTLRANDVAYNVALRYDASQRRYELDCPAFGRAFVAPEEDTSKRRDTLLAYINREQAFRLVPKAPGTIYARRHFYKPRLPVAGTGSEVDLSSILIATPQLDAFVTEKGEAGSATRAGWSRDCIFGFLDSGAVGSGMEPWMRDADILICDDMQVEASDFIVADTRNRRVAFIHAKTQRGQSRVSASKLAEVTSQAIKNLDFLNTFSVRQPSNLGRWDGSWNGGGIGTVDRRVRRPRGIPGADAWRQIREIIRHPSAEREVWVVLGRSLSVGEFQRERNSKTPAPQTIQVLYSLQSTWSAVASVGATLRFFCSP